MRETTKAIKGEEPRPEYYCRLESADGLAATEQTGPEQTGPEFCPYLLRPLRDRFPRYSGCELSAGEDLVVQARRYEFVRESTEQKDGKTAVVRHYAEKLEQG